MNDFTRRIWYFLRRHQLTRELEEEMRIHVEMRAATIGSNAAQRRFGNATNLQQRSRDMWGFGRLENLTHDVRFAFRRLAQRPAFTAAVVGVMAIGIGATTAMFSAVDAALLRPLPFDHPEQLAALNVSVPFQDPADALIRDPNSRSLYSTDVAAMTNTFSEVAAYGAGALDLADPQHPRHVNAGVVTHNFFHMLGVPPFVGRAFLESDAQPSSPRVAMLSYGLWQREYGARDIAGLKVTLAGNSYDVIGVMPSGFGFPRQSDVWIPMSIPETMATMQPLGGSVHALVVGRMRDGISASAASARMLEKWKQIRRGLPALAEGREDYVAKELIENGGATLLQQELVGDRKTALLVLLGATGLLLLVACVNVTNLLLAHGAARAREIAVRQVLGATRLRIVRQLLAESVVLSLGGALLGTLLAPLMLGVISTLMPRSLAGLAPAHIDLRILGFATTLALITGVAFGLWPALGSTHNDTSDVIKSGGGHGSTAARGGRVRRLLVGTELALTTALLIGASLMLQSFRQLMSRETGMIPEHVGTLQLALPIGTSATGDRTLRMNQILQRFSAMPDIAAAGFVNDLPLAGNGIMAVRLKIDGAATITSKDPDVAMTRWLLASSGYFDAMGIKLLRGRFIRDTDGEGAPKVVVIGERMAKTYWPNEDPVGRTFKLAMDTASITVVGIVSDVREHQLDRDPLMQMYQSAHAATPSPIALVVRSMLPERELLARMQSTIRAVDPAQAVYALRMMDDVVGISVAPRRTNTALISTFALLALALAAVGIYAVVSHGVSYRTRELGIRSALGATGSNLTQMISLEMVWVIVFGITAGIGGAWALAKSLESLVYGVSVHDPMTFIMVPLALTVPVIAATIIPARRVLQVDPAQVMRAD